MSFKLLKKRIGYDVIAVAGKKSHRFMVIGLILWIKSNTSNGVASCFQYYNLKFTINNSDKKEKKQNKGIFSSKFSNKPVSKILTIMTAVKERLQKYCQTIYSHSGIDKIWILKNSKEINGNFRFVFVIKNWFYQNFWLFNRALYTKLYFS